MTSKTGVFLLKLTTRQFAGCWFSLGASIIIIIVLIKMFDPHASYLYMAIGFLSCGLMAFYSGSQYGYLILTLEDWRLSNWIKTIIYGWCIAISSLYVMFFVLLTVDFSQTELLRNIHNQQYYLILVNLFLTPILAGLATLFGIFFEPLVMEGSALGAVLLFTLRKKILRICSSPG